MIVFLSCRYFRFFQIFKLPVAVEERRKQTVRYFCSRKTGGNFHPSGFCNIPLSELPSVGHQSLPAASYLEFKQCLLLISPGTMATAMLVYKTSHSPSNTTGGPRAVT